MCQCHIDVGQRYVSDTRHVFHQKCRCYRDFEYLNVMRLFDADMFVTCTIQDYFGFLSFRPYQREVIEKIIQKRDCLVVMATGSGKSLW